MAYGIWYKSVKNIMVQPLSIRPAVLTCETWGRQRGTSLRASLSTKRSFGDSRQSLGYSTGKSKTKQEMPKQGAGSHIEDVEARPADRILNKNFINVALDEYKNSIEKKATKAQQVVYSRVGEGVRYTKERIQDTSTAVANAVKENASLASTRLSEISRSGSEATTQFTANVSARTKQNIAEASERLVTTTKSGIHDAKNFVQGINVSAQANKIADAVSKEKLKDAISSTIHDSREAVRSRIEQSKTQLTNAGMRSSSILSEKAQLGLQQSKRAVTGGISNASSTVLGAASSLYQRMSNAFRPFFSWFWWWSLAAIGVYAIASTGTKEIVRQTFERKNQQESRQETKEESTKKQ